MGMLDLLNKPLELAKAQTPGEDWFDRPDWMPHELWAGTQVAGDLLLDPLNLVPVGLLGKGAKAGAQAFKKGAGKGMEIAGAPNYIKNFYGLTDGAADKINPAELAAVQGIQKATGLPYNEALGAVRKGTGMMGWAKESAKGALDSLSPSSRALYKEQGVHPNTQRIVDKLVQGGSRKDIEKATANVNYLNHIAHQAGREGPINPAMAEIAQRSNLETYAKNEPGTLSGWMKKNAGTEASGEAVELSDNVANIIEDHVLGSWKGADTVVMKRARSGTGGNHFNDMYRGKLAPVGPLREAFMKGGDDINSIYSHLKKNENKGANFWKVKTKDADDLAKNGLWLTGSGPGSAITEGGVNWLMKVEPDGTLMSVISDKHDFLEKMPGLGRLAAEQLPNDLVAVTPPMFANIKKIRAKQFEKAGHAVPERAVSGVQRKKQAKEANTLTLLEDFLSATPSEQAVKAEQLKQAGMLSAAPALYQGDNE